MVIPAVDLSHANFPAAAPTGGVLVGDLLRSHFPRHASEPTRRPGSVHAGTLGRPMTEAWTSRYQSRAGRPPLRGHLPEPGMPQQPRFGPTDWANALDLRQPHDSQA